MRLASLLSALVLAAAPLAAQDKATNVTIVSSRPRAELNAAILGALVDAGWAVDDATPLIVRTARRTFKNTWDLQLHTSILPLDSARSRVVVSGTYWITCCGMLKVDNRPAHESTRGVSGKMWEQLQLAADAIRRAVADPTAQAAPPPPRDSMPR